MFKKYIWKNADLKRRYNLYSRLSILMMALVLVCLYLLPADLKIINIGVILVGIYLWYMSYRTQSKDKSLKKVK